MMAPSPRFDNDDEAAQHWLMVLRDGDAAQKIQAREQLAAIFERRGMFEEATDLLVSNIRDGVRNADVFRWLARLHRAQGDEVTAMQAAAEAAKYLPPAAVAPKPAPVPPSVTQTLPAMPVPETVMPAPVAVTGPPGACPECGYVNRNARSSCKRCRNPMGVRRIRTTEVPTRSSGGGSGWPLMIAIFLGMLLLVGLLSSMLWMTGSSVMAPALSKRSGKAEATLGTRPIDFGSLGQSRELLSLIEREPGKAEYTISYETSIDAVTFGCDLTTGILARVHVRSDGHGSQESWIGYIEDRLRSAAAGGSLNDTPNGKSLVDFKVF